MRKEDLPPNGEKVLFYSILPNTDRQSLNDKYGTPCTILSRKVLLPGSPVYEDYTAHIAVEIQFPYAVDTQPGVKPQHNGGKTFADLKELRLIQK
jgi:hypothetical protein